MNLQEVIETVQDILERPDFTMESPMVRNAVYRGLVQSHSLLWSRRDLRVLSTEIGSADSKATITIPDNYRKLSTIYLLDTNGDLLSDCFTQGRLHRRPSMNHGLMESNYYITLGDELRISWGNAARQGSIEVEYYAFPTVEFDDVEQEWTTDSWLLPAYAPVIAYNTSKALAADTESSAFQALAMVAEEAEFSLLNEAAFSGSDADTRS